MRSVPWSQRLQEPEAGRGVRVAAPSGGTWGLPASYPDSPSPRSASLDQLRAERLRREATERARAEALLARVGGGAQPEEQPEETDDRRRRYNSQFNPQLARRPRWQDPPLPH